MIPVLRHVRIVDDTERGFSWWIFLVSLGRMRHLLVRFRAADGTAARCGTAAEDNFLTAESVGHWEIQVSKCSSRLVYFSWLFFFVSLLLMPTVRYLSDKPCYDLVTIAQCPSLSLKISLALNSALSGIPTLACFGSVPVRYTCFPLAIWVDTFQEGWTKVILRPPDLCSSLLLKQLWPSEYDNVKPPSTLS